MTGGELALAVLALLVLVAVAWLVLGLVRRFFPVLVVAGLVVLLLTQCGDELGQLL